MTDAIDLLLRTNLDAVSARIAAALQRSGRPAGGARLVAVTKTRGAGIIRRLTDLGVRVLGENRVQDAAPKIGALAAIAVLPPPPLEWHLIGHLQANKVRKAVELFDWIHSIDDVDLLHRVDRIAGEIGRRPKLLLQVNVSGEESKHGADPAGFARLCGEASNLRACDVVGLMTMAPLESGAGGAAAARPHFAALRELRDRHRDELGPRCTELSMGMTNDFEVAIEEGATLVRIGTALFTGVDEVERVVPKPP